VYAAGSDEALRLTPPEPPQATRYELGGRLEPRRRLCRRAAAAARRVASRRASYQSPGKLWATEAAGARAQERKSSPNPLSQTPKFPFFLHFPKNENTKRDAEKKKALRWLPTAPP